MTLHLIPVHFTSQNPPFPFPVLRDAFEEFQLGNLVQSLRFVSLDSAQDFNWATNIGAPPWLNRDGVEGGLPKKGPPGYYKMNAVVMSTLGERGRKVRGGRMGPVFFIVGKGGVVKSIALGFP